MKLQITGLAEAIQSPMKFSHVVSVVEPALVPRLPKWDLPLEHQHLAVCHDVDNQQIVLGIEALLPSRQMVRKILAFARDLTKQDTLLVHCAYGVSRSTATAYAILCQHYPKKSEEALLRAIIDLRPIAQPNSLIVAHADALLKRDGRMVAAVDAYLMDPCAFLAEERKLPRINRSE
jgi:predicted protein tyrosine phosphatase